MERPDPDTLSVTRYARGAHKPTPDHPVDPMPGTIEESEALAAIDQMRDAGHPCLSCAGTGCDSCNHTGIKSTQPRAAVRRRMRRHWSDREHALGN